MIISTALVTLRAPWAHSLKEKRMIVKSLIAQVHNKFNVSIAEVDAMDVHQLIVIGIASVCNSSKTADAIIEKVLAFIEKNTEAEMIDIIREIR